MIDVRNDFFKLRFDFEADKTMVMEGSPWIVFNHYLTI